MIFHVSHFDNRCPLFFWRTHNEDKCLQCELTDYVRSISDYGYFLCFVAKLIDLYLGGKSKWSLQIFMIVIQFPSQKFDCTQSITDLWKRRKEKHKWNEHNFLIKLLHLMSKLKKEKLKVNYDKSLECTKL